MRILIIIVVFLGLVLLVCLIIVAKFKTKKPMRSVSQEELEARLSVGKYSSEILSLNIVHFKCFFHLDSNVWRVKGCDFVAM